MFKAKLFIKQNFEQSVGLGLMTVYLLAIVSSMAGMEIMSALLLIFWITFSIKNKFVKRQAGQTEPRLSLISSSTSFSTLLSPLFLILLAFWMAIGLGATLNSHITADEAKYIWGAPRWILMCLIISHLLLHKIINIDQIAKLLLIFSFLVAVYSVVQAFTGIDVFRSAPYKPSNLAGTTIWRAKGFFSNPITFANSLGMLFSFLLGYCFFCRGLQNSYWRFFSKIVLLSLGLALILSFTRGAWLGIFVATIIQSYWLGKKRALTVGLSFLILVGMGWQFSPEFKDRVKSSFSLSEKPVGARFDLWLSHWTMFKENPILGVGYQMSMKNIEEYHFKTHGRSAMISHAHNNFLQVLSNTGSLGFIFFMASIVLTFYIIAKNLLMARNVPIMLGLLGVFINFHIAGITESSLTDGEVTHMLGLFFGVLLFSSKVNPVAAEQST